MFLVIILLLTNYFFFMYAHLPQQLNYYKTLNIYIISYLFHLILALNKTQTCF